MKKKAKRTVIILLVVAALAVGLVFGGKAILEATATRVTVYKVGDVRGFGGYSSEQSYEGTVNGDVIQEVYLNDTDIVKEINVFEGEEVEKGQILMTYDPTEAAADLEEEKINQEETELRIKVAQMNLETLARITPMPDEPFSEPDNPDRPVEPENPDSPYRPLFPTNTPTPYSYRPTSAPYYPSSAPYPTFPVYNTPTPTQSAEPEKPENPDDGRGPYLDAIFADARLDAFTDAYNEDSDGYDYAGERLGTPSRPYRFLVTNGTVITSGFMEKLRDYAAGSSLYFLLEIRTGNRASGEALMTWLLDAKYISHHLLGWEARVVYDTMPRIAVTAPTLSPTPIVVTRTPTPFVPPITTVPVTRTPTVTQAPLTVTPRPTSTPRPTRAERPTSTPMLTPTQSPTGGAQPTSTPRPTSTLRPTSTPRPTPTLRPTSTPRPTPTTPPTPEPTETPVPPPPTDTPIPPPPTDTPVPEPTQPEEEEEESRGQEPLTGSAAQSLGTAVITGRVLKLETSDLTGGSLLQAMDFEVGDYDVAGYSGLIRSDAEYTVSELKEARDAEEENLKALQLDLKETRIRVERAQRAVDEGVVRAKFSGVIRTLDETGESGSMLTLVPSSGLYIETKIPEDMLEEVSEGTTVYVDGFEGRVREISLFAASQDEYFWGGSDRPLVNYYPVTVEVSDQEASFQSGDYVTVSFSRENYGGETDTMTLMKGFVREDNGGSYVFARGEGDRLVKRYISVKTTDPYSYEILGGLVDSDWIAFAYGRDTKEGAPAIEGTAQELYS